MPFDSQFALSVEITRLVPLGGVINKAADEVMKFARDLRNSGSDIIVEADLAEFFGRCRITSGLESSFRAAVASSGGITKLCDALDLLATPGPTVSRSLLSGQGHYLSTVIQCSLLASVHNTSSLARAIVFSMEQRQDQAPSNTGFQPVPSHANVEGVLDACQEQTSQFPWLALLSSVAAKLDLEDHEIADPITSATFRGLALMFPLAQTLPQDREIVIEGSMGTCVLVVWAHHVLGLDVVVRIPKRDAPENGLCEYNDTYFGNVPATVTIIVPQSSDQSLDVEGPRVILLESCSRESLFSILQDPDEEQIITSSAKRLARGSAMRVLEADWQARTKREEKMDIHKGCLHEMMLVCIALAFRASQCIYKVLWIDESLAAGDSDNEDNVADLYPTDSEGYTPDLHRFQIPESKLFEAAMFLFDLKNIPQAELTAYIQGHRMIKTSEIPEPSTYAAVRQQCRINPANWRYHRRTILRMSLLVLTFAHVVDLSDAEGLLINRDIPALNLEDTYLEDKIWRWDGKKCLRIRNDTWFRTYLALVADKPPKKGLRGDQVASLVSSRGWSAYLPTFGTPDPCDVGPGMFFVKRGVPCRNGVRRRRIVDYIVPLPVEVCPDERKPTYSAGDRVNLRSRVPTAFGRSFYGEEEDTFMVSLRLVQKWEKEETLRTGYRRMYDAAWQVMHTSECDHFPPSSPDDYFVLPLRTCATTLQFPIEATCALSAESKIVILLTADNPAAKWAALTKLRQDDLFPEETIIMARSKTCCFSCAIQKALLLSQKCILLL